jgi:hypothetical protein
LKTKSKTFSSFELLNSNLYSPFPAFAILESMIGRAAAGLVLLAALLGAPPAGADEIRLKDGTKIVGTIVGFENDSFRVETSYGFAFVQKDKVADINISEPKKESESKAKPAGAALPPPIAAPAVVPAMAKKSAAPAAATPVPSVVSPGLPAASNGTGLVAGRGNRPAAVQSVDSSAVPTAGPNAAPIAGSGGPPIAAKGDPGSANAKTVVAALPASSTATPSAPLAAPVPPPEPLVIRDEVRGNLYVNLTYGFQMYKPPSWDLIPEARKALPDAVAALGTYDRTTLLVIGRARTKDSLDAHADATGKALADAYDNYRVISSKHVSIAGYPAIEQRSRGTADDRDWSVILLTFLKGNDAFTLLGMTWADSDLIQMQENVLSKTVNSLMFAAP